MATIVAAMSQFPRNAALLSTACEALGHLAPATAPRGADAAGADAVMAALSALLPDPSVQQAGLRALAAFAAAPAGARVLGAAGAVSLATQAMLRHERHPGVQEEGAHALGNLALDDEAAHQAVAADAVEALVSAVLAHPPELPSVQIHACRALGNLAYHSPEAQERAAACGALEAIEAAMKANPRSPALLREACRALSSIVHGSPSAQEKAAAAGVVEALVVAVQQGLPQAEPAEAAAVREAALQALSNVSHGVANEARATARGAIEAALLAMRASPEAPRVQEQGARALANLSVSASNQQRAVGAGALEVLIDALRRHGADPAVTEAACSALRNLSYGPDNKSAMRHVGGVDEVVAALSLHANSPAVAAQAALALANCAADPESERRAVLGGAFEALFALLEGTIRSANPDPEVAARALQALCNLLGAPEHQAAAALGGALELALEALEAFPRDAAVQEAGFVLLRGLYGTEEAAQRPLDEAAVPTVLAGMRACPAALGVQHEGCRAVGALTAWSDPRKARAAEAGAVDALKAAAEAAALAGDAAGVEFALGALAGLATAPQVALQAHAAGAVELAAAAMKRFPHSPGVQQEGLRLSANLCAHPAGLAKMLSKGGLELSLAALDSHPAHPTVAQQGVRALGNMLAGGDIGNEHAGAAVRVLLDHSATPEVALESLTAIAALAHKGPGPVDRLALAGALEAVMSALRSHGDDPAVQAAGAVAVAALAATPRTQARLADLGAIPFEVHVLRVHAAHPEVVSAAVRALGALTHRSLDNKAKAGAAGAVEAVLSAGRAHLHGPDVPTEAAGALANMFALKENLRSAGEFGALDFVLEALARFPQDALMQQEGLRALRFLTDRKRSPKLNHDAVVRGAAELVLRALGTHPQALGVQEQGVVAFRNLVDDTGPAVGAAVAVAKAELDRAAEEGPRAVEGPLRSLASILLALGPRDAEAVPTAVTAIHAALAAHPADPGVQAAGLRALSNLVRVGIRSPPAPSPLSHQQVSETGGGEVLNTPSGWSRIPPPPPPLSDPQTFEKDDIKEGVLRGDERPLDLLADALRKLSDDPLVSEEAFLALSNMATVVREWRRAPGLPVR